MMARKRASYVWEGEKSVDENPPTADALVARNHTRERKEEEEEGVAPTLLLTRVLVV
jgi:hypothetical protein